MATVIYTGCDNRKKSFSYSKRKGKVDWHLHTTASDGELSPVELARKAKVEWGLEEIAITDHDTIEGVREAILEGDRIGIKVIAGVELTSYDIFDGEKIELHIKGLDIDPNNRNLNKFLHEARKIRERRARLMVEKLKKFGYEISTNAVKNLAKGVLSRPHIATILMRSMKNKELLKKN
ncbi:MAG: PHP domain-containing protein, partial [Candidatus Micrarchaeia archaeon]